MKKSVYIDSTILSIHCDNRSEIANETAVTIRWWREERNNFSLFISEETIAEIVAGNYPRKDEVIALAESITVLPPEPHITEIASVYLAYKLMPEPLKGDALHLAYASFYKIDFLLTWNCNHLANANKRQHIRVVNTRLNLSVPEIITPFELFTETDK